jgi:hypothetical protein
MKGNLQVISFEFKHRLRTDALPSRYGTMANISIYLCSAGMSNGWRSARPVSGAGFFKYGKMKAGRWNFVRAKGPNLWCGWGGMKRLFPLLQRSSSSLQSILRGKD